MRLKKLLSFLVTLVAVSVICSVSAGAETYGDYTYYTEYDINGNEQICIYEYSGTATSLTIPSTINGKKVVGIGSEAFAKNTTLKSVTIPDSVTYISGSAFLGCTSLTTVKLSSKLDTIGSHAFRDCTSLKSITFPSSLSVIESHAFRDCDSLTSVSLNNGLEELGSYAFMYCDSLETVSVPSSLKEMGEDVFYTTPLLDNQTTNVKYAGNWAVDVKDNASEATIKSGTVGIAPYSLMYLEQKSITIPDTVTYIGDYAFAYGMLESVDIPDSVKFVGNDAFYDNPVMNNATGNVIYVDDWLVFCDTEASTIEIAEGTRGIANSSFSNSPNFSGAIIPDSVEYINDYAMYIGYDGATYYVPDSVKEVGRLAFGYNDVILYTKNKVLLESDEYADDCYDMSKLPSGAVKVSSMTPTSVTLNSYIKSLPSWAKIQIYLYDSAKSSYVYKASLTSATSTYKLSSLSPNTFYKLRLRACYTINGQTFYTDYFDYNVHTPNSDSGITALKNKINSGYVADINKTYISIEDDIYTYSVFDRWASVPEAIQFFDHNGNINFAIDPYTYSSTFTIVKLDSNNKKVSELEIDKKYNKLGSVICDDSGNYYVVWGDNVGSELVLTDTAIAVSKYSNAGKHIKTTTYSRQEVNTAYPFDAGNCDVVINNGVLVCNFARQMCNGSSAGHQSNTVIAVNISDMSKNKEYGTYNSHSFDQRVIADKYGEIWLASHGDFYNRAFTTQFGYNTYDLFHFYLNEADKNDMWVVNVTKAQLGGLADSSAGVMLVAASVKGMTASTYSSQTKNLFITSADGSITLSGTTSRTGTVCGNTVTDKNIKWLTNYTAYSVNNPQVVSTDRDEIVILWEKLDSDGSFVESCYMVLASNGLTIQPETSMGDVRLNANEMPLYRNGKVYWIEGDGYNCYAVELNIGELVEYYPAAETPGDFEMSLNSTSSIRLSWEQVRDADGYIIEHYTGTKWIRTKKIADPRAEEVSITGLKSGKNYKFRIKSYRFVDGVAYYSDVSSTLTACTKPAKPIAKMTLNSSSSIRIGWDAISGANGYIIYVKKDGAWTRIGKVTSGSTVTYSATGLSSGTTYEFKVYAYKTLGGKAYYSAASTVFKGCTKPAKVSAKVSSATASSVTISWNKVTGANGYIIQQYKDGAWVRVGKTTSTSLTVSSLASGTTCEFRVCAYKSLSGKAYYGSYSATVTATTK